MFPQWEIVGCIVGVIGGASLLVFIVWLLEHAFDRLNS